MTITKQQLRFEFKEGHTNNNKKITFIKMYIEYRLIIYGFIKKICNYENNFNISARWSIYDVEMSL